jgi:hypothetical protein
MALSPYRYLSCEPPEIRYTARYVTHGSVGAWGCGDRCEPGVDVRPVGQKPPLKCYAGRHRYHSGQRPLGELLGAEADLTRLALQEGII